MGSGQLGGSCGRAASFKDISNFGGKFNQGFSHLLPTAASPEPKQSKPVCRPPTAWSKERKMRPGVCSFG